MNKVNYGFDAPKVMRNFFLLSIVLATGGGVALQTTNSIFLKYTSYLFISFSCIFLMLGLIMFFYGVKGKFIMRDFMLNKINWTGNENVLDVGTGRGLFMIGAAKYLRKGKSIGIDIWNEQDLSGNTVENAYKNAELENVKDKIKIKNEDVRMMSFENNTFDVIFSMYCLHNIEDKKEQEKACFEIARVLKPQGKVLVGDFVPTHDYATYFTKAGLKIKNSRQYFHIAFAPMWMVEAEKQTDKWTNQ